VPESRPFVPAVGLRNCHWLPLAALALLAACQRMAEVPVPEVRPVRAITIDKRAAGGSVALTGTVQAQTEINQSFRIDGRMVERTVDIGDNVRRGQLIARLDPQNEESALQSARAQLAGANAQLVEARSNYTRMAELVVEDAVSRAQYEQAKALLQSAEAQVLSVQGQVSLAQNRLSYTRLYSDVAGVVTARGPQPGEVVGAGRMIIQVAREGTRDAVFDVPAQIKDSAPLDPEVTVALGKTTPSPRQTDIVVSLSTSPAVTAKGRVR
jgi:RND family efflux transporter MFP subunit